MNRTLVDQVADAVLYEGYLLYPYRPSVKNRQRWTFGGLYPRSYSEGQTGSDRWTSQTQCLVRSSGRTRLNVRVRFLHLQLRTVAGDETAWQEAVEREVLLEDRDLAGLRERTEVHAFSHPSHREEAQDPDSGRMVVREQHAIAGLVELSSERVAEGFDRVTVQVRNDTTMPDDLASDRDAALLRTLVSSHVILGVRDGAFVSMTDPPVECRALADGCRNIGVWPVLAGEPGTFDTMLASPIILYDYPQVAPESPGDLFDATEIDEILTLRILTLTDIEKRAMIGVDDRARSLLERTESLAREQLNGLHGTLRGLQPWNARDPWNTDPSAPIEQVEAAGVTFRRGDRVRVWPLGDADIFDMALKGKTARIAAIERDLEDRIHLAVTLDDDPGQDLGLEGKPGHRFFFHPEELEPIAADEGV